MNQTIKKTQEYEKGYKQAIQDVLQILNKTTKTTKNNQKTQYQKGLSLARTAIQLETQK